MWSLPLTYNIPNCLARDIIHNIEQALCLSGYHSFNTLAVLVAHSPKVIEISTM